MREKRPNSSDWVERPTPPAARDDGALAQSWWRNGTLVVGSILAHADYPDGKGAGPQWMVSVCDAGQRPTRTALRRALRAFDMLGAEEDNHHPGIARHFWQPVDPARRVDCECKATETTITEPDGYRWTNPTDGPCRGCELGRLKGTACPIHGEITMKTENGYRSVRLRASEVRTLLAHDKVMIRRPVRRDDSPISEADTVACKHQRGVPHRPTNVRMCGYYLKCDSPAGSFAVSSRVDCPLGSPGDLLWVREPWWWRDSDRLAMYAADQQMRAASGPAWESLQSLLDVPVINSGLRKTAERLRAAGWALRPSMAMPRWASRLIVRIELLGVEKDTSGTTWLRERRSGLVWIIKLTLADA